MSELKIKGKITKVLDIETGTSKANKEWKKQGFVIDTGAQYNPEVCFQIFGDDKINELAKHKVGDDVNVSFNLSSREFNGKYYHNLDAWKVFKAEEVVEEFQGIDNQPSLDDDLPF